VDSKAREILTKQKKKLQILEMQIMAVQTTNKQLEQN
jgi:hypothetical protein